MFYLPPPYRPLEIAELSFRWLMEDNSAATEETETNTATTSSRLLRVGDFASQRSHPSDSKLYQSDLILSYGILKLVLGLLLA
jgi:hypothetical protein